MKIFKNVLVIGLAVLLTGCVLTSNAKYAADTAFYNAQKAAADLAIAQGNRPLVKVQLNSGEILTVNNQIPVAIPPIRQLKNGWVESFKAVINSTPLSIVSGGWAAREMLKHSGGGVEIQGDGNTASPVSNSYNTETTDVSTATDGSNLDQHSDSSDQSRIDSSDNSNHSDNSDNRTDYNNQTATPTIVDQPVPIIVDPVIVDPVVVNPITVDPIIVNPVVIDND